MGFARGIFFTQAWSLPVRLEHRLYCFVLQTELATVPAKILEVCASKDSPMPAEPIRVQRFRHPELDLEQGWELFDMQHDLTRKGIEKLVADHRATLARPA